VVEGGCLLTEADDGTDPQPGRFLTRNRLIAALGGSTVVVQAPARSGALSTARVARGLSRPVFALPASPWDPRGAGNLRLLLGGAQVCVRPADVLSESPPPGGRRERPSSQKAQEVNDFRSLNESEQTILAGLAGRARHPDELCQRTGIPAFQVQQSILRLLVLGLIEERPGGRYQSCRAGRKPY
jgi:DNA processing protein